jgi:hypothetical protein
MVKLRHREATAIRNCPMKKNEDLRGCKTPSNPLLLRNCGTQQSCKEPMMGKGNSLQDRSAAKTRTYSGELTFAAKLGSPNSLRPYEQSDELDLSGELRPESLATLHMR